MRIPPRWLIACSVVGSLAASGTAVLVLPQPTAQSTGIVDLPSFDPGPPAPEPTGTGPAVTGRQIAELAAGPAVRRAEELAAQATPRPAPRPSPSAGGRREATACDRIKKACKESG